MGVTGKMNAEIMSDRKSLSVLMRAFYRFNQFDSKIQVSTILTLLEIAAAEQRGEDISVQDIEKRVGLQSGTASRNVYYWGEGHKEMKGGHQMITIDFDINDRRRRSLRLTAKGKAFIRDMLEGVNLNG